MENHQARRKLVQATRQTIRRVRLYKAGKLWATAGVSVLLAAGGWTMRPQQVQAAADEAGLAVIDQADAPAATTPPSGQPAAVVTVGNTKQTYDAQASTPLTCAVQLPAGIKAPSGWYVAAAPDHYLVPAASGDITGAADTQAVGQHALTLSESGLARLEAANPGRSLTVAAGSLTIVPASVASGAVTIHAAQKDQGQADPTSYTVTIDSASHLQAPASWTANADGSYTIAAASGDLDLSALAQSPGRYPVTLSPQGLAALAAANPNYALNPSAVAAGSLTINSIAQAVIASTTVAQHTKLPQTVTVTIMHAAGYAVPGDWTRGYTNPQQASQAYNVPIADFDTSQVDLAAAGKYTLTFNAQTLAALNAANPTQPMQAAMIEAGTLTVVAQQPAQTTIYPANFGVTVAGPRVDLRKLTGNQAFSYGNGAAAQGYVVSRHSALTLSAAVLGYNFNGKTVEKLTDFLILPPGFLIGQATAAGSVVADAPAKALQAQLIASLKTAGVAYTDLTVTQLADYNRRQTFAIQFAQAAYGKAAQFTIVADPASQVPDGFIGTHTATPDAAVLYATDDPAFTNGAYTVSGYGEYTSDQAVAAALGVRNAYALSAAYDNSYWVAGYTFVNAPVQDTYQLIGPNQVLLDQVTTTGASGSVYDVLTKLPQTLTQNGQLYAIDASQVALTQTYPPATTTLTTLDAVAPGNTYAVPYLAVLNAQGRMLDQTIPWHNNAVPASFSLQLPAGLQPAAGWVENADGTYAVPTASGDLTLADEAGAVGTYMVALSDLGLAKLAAANPEVLFDNGVVAPGQLTITSVQVPVAVQVVDTTGKPLQAPQQLTFTIPGTGTYQSLVIAPIGYADTALHNQLHGVTIVARDGSTNSVVVNADHTLTKTDAAGAATIITPTGDASEFLYQEISNSVSALTFADQPQRRLDASAQNAIGEPTAPATIIVTFNPHLTGTVVFHDDTHNVDVAVPTPVTFSGFVGDQGTITVDLAQLGLAQAYALASGQSATAAYTIVDGSNQLVVHLVQRQTVTVTLNVMDTAGKTLSQPQSVTLNSPGIGRSFQTLVVAPAGYDDQALIAQIHQVIVEEANGDRVTVVANADGTVTMHDPDGSSHTITPTTGSASAYLHALVVNANALITFGNQTQHTVLDTDEGLNNLATLPRAVTVVYNAAVTGTVVFHDDLNQVDVESAEPLTYGGYVGQSGSVTIDLNALGLAGTYALASGQASTMAYTLVDTNNQLVVHLVKRQVASVSLNVVDTTGQTLAPTQNVTWQIPGVGSSFQSLVVSPAGYSDTAVKEQIKSITVVAANGDQFVAVANADNTVTLTDPDGTSETITPPSGSASAYLYTLFSAPDSLISFHGQPLKTFADTDQVVSDLAQKSQAVTVVYNSLITGTVLFRDVRTNQYVPVAQPPTYSGFVGDSGTVVVDLDALGLGADYMIWPGYSADVDYRLSDGDNHSVLLLLAKRPIDVTLNVIDTNGKSLAPQQVLSIEVPGLDKAYQSLVIDPAGYDDSAVREQIHAMDIELINGDKGDYLVNDDNTVTIHYPNGTSETSSGFPSGVDNASLFLAMRFSANAPLFNFRGQPQNTFTMMTWPGIYVAFTFYHVTVVYNAMLTGTVVFHDDVTNTDVDISDPLTYQGFVGDSGTVQVDLEQLGLADEYALADGQASALSYTLSDGLNQLVVHLVKRQVATVTYVDTVTGDTLQVDRLVGLPNATSAYTTADKLAELVDQGYEVLSDDYPTAGMTFDHDSAVDQAYTVNLGHRLTTLTPEDPQGLTLSHQVTRTIHFLLGENGPEMFPDVVQTVTLTRSATIDAVTHAVSYSDWNSDDFPQLPVPSRSGFAADYSIIPEMVVTSETPDSELTVVYNAVSTGGTIGVPTTGGGTSSSSGSSGTPSSGGSSGTPSSGGSSGASSSSGSGGTPPSNGSKGAPSSSGSGGTPPSNGSKGTPSSSGSGGTPPSNNDGGHKLLPDTDGDSTGHTPSVIDRRKADSLPQAAATNMNGIHPRRKLPQTSEADPSGLALAGMALVSLLGLTIGNKRRKD